MVPSSYQGLTALIKSANTVALATAIGSPGKPPWRKAIDFYLSKLTHEQLNDLLCPTDPSGLIEVLRDIENHGKSKKTAKFLEFLSKYTQPLQQFQGAIEVVIQTKAEIGSPIWAPMKLVLILLKNHNDACDTLAEQFSLICRKLPIYEAYCELFPSSAGLQDALAKIYIDYLDFCFKAINHFKRNGVLTLARSMGRPFHEEFKEILNNMDIHRQSVDDAVRLSAWTEQVTTHKSARQEKTLRWLSPSVFDSELAEFAKKWVPGTCGWVLHRDEYKDWLGGALPDKPGLLWVSWPAGYGKSFIAHFIRKSLPSRQPPLFFFFNSKQENSGKRTAVTFLRTILHQLLTSLSDTDLLEACFSVLNPIAEQSGHHEASSIGSLWEATTKIFRKIPSLYIVIDALDECNIQERDLLFEKLVSITNSNKGINVVITSRPEIDIQKTFEKLPVGACSRLRFERKYVDEDLIKYVKHRLQQSEMFTNDSLRKEVEKEVLKHADGMFLYVRLTIDDLELEATSGAVRKRLKNLPKSLIDYYHNIIREISKRSDSRCQLARDIFLWAITAYRPLKVQELISALGAQRQRLACINRDNDVDWPLLGDPTRAIRDACFPLVEILEDQTVQVVHTSVTQYLLCQWVDNKAVAVVPISPFAYKISEAHNEAVLATLDFLSSQPHREHCDSAQAGTNQMNCLTNTVDALQVTSGASSDLSDNRGFHSYCVLNWDLHARESEEHLNEQRGALFKFCEGGNGKALSRWIQARSSLDFRFKLYFGLKSARIEPTLLHIAVYFNLYQFVNEILLRGFDLTVVDATGAAPLHIAAGRGFDKLVQRMLQAGADKELRDNNGKNALHRAAAKGHFTSVEGLLPAQNIDCLDNMGRSALFIACRYGKEPVARRLIADGADPGLQSVSGETPLSSVVTNGYLEISRLLLDTKKGWDLLADRRKLCHLVAAGKGYIEIVELLQLWGADLKSMDNIGQTAFHIAALGGNKAAVVFLRETGVDVNTKDHRYMTALHIAAMNGYQFVVEELLLKDGIEVNAEDNYSRTALHLAAKSGSESVVGLLLDAGAKVSAKDRDSQTALHLAAKSGSESVVGLLLNAGAEVNAKDQLDRTALHLAAKSGSESVVGLLLNAGAEVSAKGSFSRTALHLAAESGSESIVGLLLDAGAEVNAKGSNSRTALHLAAESGSESIVGLLLNAGVKANAKDYASQTELHLAAKSGSESVVGLLLNAGAEVNAKDHLNRTALHLAAESGSESVVGLLLNAEAEMDTKDSYSQRGVHHLVESGNGTVVDAAIGVGVRDQLGRVLGLHIATMSGDSAAVELLLKAGAEVNAEDDDGQTALHLAAENGSESVVGLLLDAGAGVNAKNQLNRTALHLAAKSGSGSVVGLLLDAGAEVNAKDHLDRTALHLAAESGSESVVGLLLDAGAEVNAKDYCSQTELHLAAKSGSESIVGLLLNAGVKANAKDYASQTELHLAAKSGSESVVGLLLNAGAKVNAKDYCSQTALHLAAESGSESVVGLLLDAGAEVNAKSSNSRTALHTSIKHGNLVMMIGLLKYGADPNEMDDTRQSALHLAAEGGHDDLVQPLLEAGSVVDAVDNSRCTALHYACKGGFLNIIEELLEADADYSIQNNDGRTPADLAMEHGDPAILALFL